MNERSMNAGRGFGSGVRSRPGEAMENGVTKRLAHARERALSELKARGASRQKTLVENVRSVGVRGLVSGAVASARELLREPDSNGRAVATAPPPSPPPRPILVDPI